MAASWLTNVLNFIAGVQYQSVPGTISDGANGPMQSDRYGRPVMNIAAYGGDAGTSWWDSTALGYQGTAKVGSAKLWQVIATNEGASKRWLMLFDATALPGNGTAPKFQLPMSSGQIMSLPPACPRTFATGIFWAVSSTAGTLTLDNTATFFVNVEFQ
jgi:hypothetical protein